MNAFADTLFTLLFGWLKAGVQGIWNLVTQGHGAGFFTWMGDHWLIVAVFLCLLCTALDYLVWMVRWRPYLVWKTKLRCFKAWIHGHDRERKQRFAQGYQGDAMIAAGTGNVPFQPEYGQAQPAPEDAPWGNPAPAPDVPSPEESGNSSAYDNADSSVPNAWGDPQYASWQGPEAGNPSPGAGASPSGNSPYATWQPPREGSDRP